MDDTLLASRNDTVRALVRALENHGPGEGAHADRVAVYATATGDKLGLEDDNLLELRWAASLHDVGKISIDPELIRKLGKLTDSEMAQLRSHATLALKIVDEFDWLKPTVPMIRHHHERFDGTGYPDGLTGDEIPLGARIIAVAETFDVLTQRTPWREPMPIEDALEEIKRCSEAQFDPQVVAAFCEVQPLIQPVAIEE